jgi:hypothetical protein
MPNSGLAKGICSPREGEARGRIVELVGKADRHGNNQEWLRGERQQTAAKNSPFFALARAGTAIALNSIDVPLNISYLNQGDTMTIYAAPGTAGAKIDYKAQYDNFIGGKWVAPVKGSVF